MALTQVSSGLISSVANTAITGNIISSQITSVANTQITGLITPSQMNLSFSGTSSTEAIKFTNAAEAANLVSIAITANTTLYLANGAVQFYTANAASNTTVNITWSSSTTMNTAMAVGDTITVAMLFTNGANTWWPNVYQIDGLAATPKWQGGSAPTSGNASGIDAYTFTVIKTAATPTYTFLASQSQFK
jgi:hypothetical protein